MKKDGVFYASNLFAEINSYNLERKRLKEEAEAKRLADEKKRQEEAERLAEEKKKQEEIVMEELQFAIKVEETDKNIEL